MLVTLRNDSMLSHVRLSTKIFYIATISPLPPNDSTLSFKILFVGESSYPIRSINRIFSLTENL